MSAICQQDDFGPIDSGSRVRVLCDVHIALKVVRFFQKKNIEAIHVNELPDSFYTSDKDICKFSDQNDYVVVTKDSDFLDSYLVRQTPMKLIKVNLGNISTPELIAIFEQHCDFFTTYFEKGSGCIEVSKNSIFVHEPMRL